MYLSIGEAAISLGVSVCTVRRWSRAGKISIAHRTVGGHRRFCGSEVDRIAGKPVVYRKTAVYSRVSSHDQKADLDRQEKRLLAECANRGFDDVVAIRDLGSGLNFKKSGLKKLLNMIWYRQIERLVITHKDRLLRFGNELVFGFCYRMGIEVIIVDEESHGLEERLAYDVIELMTVFAARLHGSRSRKNKAASSH